MLKSVLIKIAEQKTQELFDKEWKDKNITNTSKCGLRKKKKKISANILSFIICIGEKPEHKTV